MDGQVTSERKVLELGFGRELEMCVYKEGQRDNDVIRRLMKEFYWLSHRNLGRLFL